MVLEQGVESVNVLFVWCIKIARVENVSSRLPPPHQKVCAFFRWGGSLEWAWKHKFGVLFELLPLLVEVC